MRPIFLALIIIGAFCGCTHPPTPPTAEQLIGTWETSEGDTICRIEFALDGVYRSELITGQDFMMSEKALNLMMLDAGETGVSTWSLNGSALSLRNVGGLKVVSADESSLIIQVGVKDYRYAFSRVSGTREAQGTADSSLE